MAEFDFAFNLLRGGCGRPGAAVELVRLPIAVTVGASRVSRAGGWRGIYRGIVDAWLGGQNVLKAAHGCCAALEDVRHPADGDHGKNQLNQKGIERREGAQRDARVNYFAAANSQQDYHRQADQRGKGREEKTPRADQLDVLVYVIPVGGLEGSDFGLFLHVGTNNAHSR